MQRILRQSVYWRDTSSRLYEQPFLLSVAVQRLQSSNTGAESRQAEAETSDQVASQLATSSSIPTGQAPVSQGVRELMLKTWRTRKGQERSRRSREAPPAQASTILKAPVDGEGQADAEG